MKAISDPETKERDGMPFTVQRFATKAANITIIRPVLSPEEREQRMQALSDSIAAFWRAIERNERRKQNASSDSI